MAELRIAERPELRRPVLVAAFRGWNDGGTGASLAGSYLARTWNATRFADIDPEGFYDFQVNRPQVSLVEGLTRRIEWAENAFYHGAIPGLDRDAVLLLGVEPNLRWRTFCGHVVEFARELGVELVVTLGALLADVPHTRPSPVTGSATDLELVERLGLSTSRYEGPTGIVGVLADTLARSGMQVLMLWSAIPHYVSHPPCPKATLALLSQLEKLLGVDLDLGELAELARAWERGVDELAAEDAEVAEYVAQLEQQQDATQLPEASGEAIAAEFERYLRRGSS